MSKRSIEEDEESDINSDGGDSNDESSPGCRKNSDGYENQFAIPSKTASRDRNHKSYVGVTFANKEMTIKYVDNVTNTEDELVFGAEDGDYTFKKLNSKKKGRGMVKGEILEHRNFARLSTIFFRFSGTIVHRTDDDSVFTSLKREEIGDLASIIDFFTQKHPSGDKKSNELTYISCRMEHDSFLDNKNNTLDSLESYVARNVDVIARINFSLFTHKQNQTLTCKPRLLSGRIRLS
ncbi:hypothetical protein SK128_026575, partial [Halocaridina rubra]